MARLKEIGGECADYRVLPDDQKRLADALIAMADEKKCDLILTTGGTGLGPRDVTPEATKQVIDREVPGIAEAMRAQTYAKTPFAMISRGVSGIRGRTLVINLPGNPKGVDECLDVIIPVLPHTLAILTEKQSGH
jgi:molybdenum cofactor synthesis domain-containing protein